MCKFCAHQYLHGAAFIILQMELLGHTVLSGLKEIWPQAEGTPRSVLSIFWLQANFEGKGRLVCTRFACAFGGEGLSYQEVREKAIH